MPAIVRLFDTRVRIVTGKGGVGKSVVALSMALIAAKHGKRVLFLETNPPESITRFLDKRPLTGEPRWVYDNLWMAALVPSEAIKEYALMTLKFKALYSAVFENRIVRYFLRAVPSLAEFVMLGKLWFHEGEREGDRPKYDLIVVDAPATGHLISWLRVPHVFVEMMPAGPLSKHSQDYLDMLLNPARAKLDIVTVPEEMPVNEAVELDQATRKHRLCTRGLTIINRVTPPLPAALVSTFSERLAAADADTQKRFSQLQHVVHTREHWRELGERYLQRLPADDLSRAIRLLRRPMPVSDEASVRALANELEAQL